jgi:exosortase
MSHLAHLGVSAERDYVAAQTTRRLWPRIAIIAGLVFWLYASIIFRLLEQWWADPDFSHGFLVPIFSIFVIWRDRFYLRSLRPKPSWFGFPLLAFSLLILGIGVLGAELFFSRVSLLLLLAGLVILFLGWNYFRRLLFPWLFLFLMIPIPELIFNQVTMPLQTLVSKIAASALPLCGVPVLREGNIINLPVLSLEVAEACSGVRSLVSLIALAIIFGYLAGGRNWTRIVMAFTAVPIAIITNSLRIIVTGLLVQYWDPHRAEGFFHIFSGWLLFLAAIGILLLVQRVLAYMDRKRGYACGSEF